MKNLCMTAFDLDSVVQKLTQSVEIISPHIMD